MDCEDRLLVGFAQSCSVEELAKLLNRSVEGTRGRLRTLGISQTAPYQDWTPKAEKRLRALALIYGTKQIADMMRMPYQRVYRKMIALGLQDSRDEIERKKLERIDRMVDTSMRLVYLYRQAGVSSCA